MQHLVLKTTFRFIVPAVTRGGHRRIRRDTSGGSGAKGGEREQSPSEPCTAVLFSGMIARPRKAGEIITETPPTWGVHVYNGHASRVVRWCVPGSSPRMFRGRPVRHVFRPPVRACGLSHHRFLGHSGGARRTVDRTHILPAGSAAPVKNNARWSGGERTFPFSERRC